MRKGIGWEKDGIGGDECITDWMEGRREMTGREKCGR